MSARAGFVATAVALLLQGAGAAPARAQESATEVREEAPTEGLDRVTRTFLLAELLEYVPDGRDDAIDYEGLGWIGGDYHRVWLRAEGEHATRDGSGALHAEVLYGKLLTPFWDAVVGLGVESRYGGADGATRALLTLGLQGLAPYWFEMEPSLYVSQDGDISARLSTALDLLVTQRLIVEPRLELTAAVQEVPDFGVGSGLNAVEVGARVRYEIRREFAPYIGVSWLRRTAGTADLARRAGEPVSDGVFVTGLRLWR